MKTEELKQALDKHTEEEMERYDSLHGKIDKILTNHLPHVELAITRLTERMSLVMWVFGVVGGAVLLGLIGALLTLILK